MTRHAKRTPIFFAALLSLLLSAFAALPAAGQELSPEHLAVARRYIDLTDKGGLYETTIVQAGINTLRQLLPQNPQLSEELNTTITKVLSYYRERKGDLFDQIARVYALNFDIDELKQIVAFYESPVGVKLARANSELNASVARVVNVFSINLQTEFFAKVRAEMKALGHDV